MFLFAIWKCRSAFEDNEKNRLVFPNRCEELASLTTIHLLFAAAGRSKLFWENTTVSPLPQKLLSAIMYFFATSRTEEWKKNITAEDTLFGKNRFLFRRRNQDFGKNPTKKIRHRHFVEKKCYLTWSLNFVKIRHFIMTLSGFPSKLHLSTDTTYSWLTRTTTSNSKDISPSATSNFRSRPRDYKRRDIFHQ